MEIWRPIIALSLCVAAVGAEAQDIAEGTVLAYDRVANIIVFTDKSVWSLEKLEAPVPEQLKSGDKIKVEYDSNEDEGLTVIHSIEILP